MGVACHVTELGALAIQKYRGAGTIVPMSLNASVLFFMEMRGRGPALFIPSTPSGSTDRGRERGSQEGSTNEEEK